MVQNCLNWLYQFVSSLISLLFNLEVVNGVSYGSFIVVSFLSSLVITNILMTAKKD